MSLNDTETDVHNSLGGTGVGVGVGVTHCPSSFTVRLTNDKYKRQVKIHRIIRKLSIMDFDVEKNFKKYV